MSSNFKVVINYSENDNSPAIDSSKGWVDNFQRYLSLMLHQVIGNKAEVILKPGGEKLADGVLKDVDAMVCLVSQYFIENGDCMDGIEDFYQVARQTEGIDRIFKVMKSPLKVQEQPMRLREMLSYEMFHFDEETQEAEEFEAYMSAESEAEREFWMKMVDLVYDLNEAYYGLRDESHDERIRPIGDRRTVYLAESGPDLTIQRNIIKRELQRFGFKVLPSQALPANEDALVERVRKDLESCSLSIHLIGSSYGYIPEGAQKSTVDTQNRIAGEWSSQKVAESQTKNETVRFIWISPNLKVASEKQLTFIENVKRDVSALEGAEILQTPLEDFKNIIREELFSDKEHAFRRMAQAEDNGGDQNVYLIHDRVDDEAVGPLKSQIEKMGYTVIEPSFEGNLLDLRENHIRNLRKLDFALVYQGHVNDQWVRMKLLDLLKAPGFGRSKPILNKGVVISKYSKGEFEKLNKDKNVDILHESGDTPPVEDIKRFLQTRQQVL